MKIIKKRVALLTIALMAAIYFTGCATGNAPLEEEALNKQYNNANLNTLDLSNIAGDINITEWSNSTIEVKAVKKGWFQYDLDKISVNVSESGNTLTIETIQSKPASSAFVNYTISVPAGFAARIKSVSGNITVSDLDILEHVEATSGNITIRNAESVRNVKNTSGNIKVDIKELNPTSTIEAVSGNITIHVTEPNPSVSTQTVSGNVNFHGISSGGNGKISLKTTSGNIDIYKM